MAASAVFAAGCAAIPASGPVQTARGSVGQVQEYPQPIAVGPRPGWNPLSIVSGFLHASASFLDNHAIARQYLTAGLARTWHPGWAATVLASNPLITSLLRPARIVAGDPPRLVDHVTVTGSQLATLTDSGQYETSSGSQTYHFTLVRNPDGLWRIESLPAAAPLLLTQPDFVEVYQPHNLYFFAPSGQVLVPDPVFVPQAATNTDLARGLVTALRGDPTGWLAGTASTAFPAATTLLSLKINGSSVMVDLGGAAGRTGRSARVKMAAQLVWTLESPSYSGSDFQSVVVEINGRQQDLTGQPYQLLHSYTQWMPPPPPGPLYYLGAAGLSVLPGAGRAPHPVPGAAGYPFKLVAVSPDGTSVAGIESTAGGRHTVYTGPISRLRHAGLVARQLSGSAVTSLSWDPAGNVWAAAGPYPWRLPPGAGPPALVVTGLPPSDAITALQVAPDGVRIAMIIRTSTGARQLAFGAITRAGLGLSIGQTVPVGPGIFDPEQLTWYNADTLLVLAAPGPKARLYEVPVNGGQPNQIAAQPGMVSIASSGSALTAGTAAAEILVSSGPNAPWQPVTAGQDPAYPG